MSDAGGYECPWPRRNQQSEFSEPPRRWSEAALFKSPSPAAPADGPSVQEGIWHSGFTSSVALFGPDMVGVLGMSEAGLVPLVAGGVVESLNCRSVP